MCKLKEHAFQGYLHSLSMAFPVYKQIEHICVTRASYNSLGILLGFLLLCAWMWCSANAWNILTNSIALWLRTKRLSGSLVPACQDSVLIPMRLMICTWFQWVPRDFWSYNYLSSRNMVLGQSNISLYPKCHSGILSSKTCHAYIIDFWSTILKYTIPCCSEINWIQLGSYLMSVKPSS